MREFLDDRFLLKSPAAERLFQGIKDLPIIDFHCHLLPEEIANDRAFDNITELWLGHDHYKWRAMRFHGVEERLITGDADPQDKFRAFAQTLTQCAGNPLYHWSHLELARYFGVTEPLTGRSSDRIYARCNEVLRQGLRARRMIRDSRVELICTTDDPCDTLEHHRTLQAQGFETRVVPSFRPDGALRIGAAGFRAYVDRLSAAAAQPVGSFAALCGALARRLDTFCECGCRLSDHALTRFSFVFERPEAVDAAFGKAMRGEALTEREIQAYETALLLFLARAYKERGVVMQLHVGCMRNINGAMYSRLGADSGYDAIGETGALRGLAEFLDSLAQADALPRTILYPLDDGSSRALMTICTSFGGDGRRGYVQLGPAWWFNDTKSGMEKQLRDFAELGCLGDSVGMLTDSRSLISYPRHEYFRRILCNFVGQMIEDGEYPPDFEAANTLLRNICYENAKRYFNL